MDDEKRRFAPFPINLTKSEVYRERSRRSSRRFLHWAFSLFPKLGSSLRAGIRLRLRTFKGYSLTFLVIRVAEYPSEVSGVR